MAIGLKEIETRYNVTIEQGTTIAPRGFCACFLAYDKDGKEIMLEYSMSGMDNKLRELEERKEKSK